MNVWLVFSHGRPEGATGPALVVGLVGIYASEAGANEAYDTLVRAHPDATYSIETWRVEP